ncbi:MAG: hypothetical protein CV087_01265 [Candidatus Brocadia sp. WS118]|nr:MAG: hypothetical protein CV087_01265 [Candidatus Brocadia sp. WS118]
MGAHRTNKGLQTRRDCALPSTWPELPNNIGKTKRIPAIDGRIRHFRIEDEIIHPQSNSNRKIIVLQKMRFIEEDRIEFRFGYYMIGMKPKAKGRWVWGQFCLLIPQEDLMAILEEEKNEGGSKTINPTMNKASRVLFRGCCPDGLFFSLHSD